METIGYVRNSWVLQVCKAERRAWIQQQWRVCLLVSWGRQPREAWLGHKVEEIERDGDRAHEGLENFPTTWFFWHFYPPAHVGQTAHTLKHTHTHAHRHTHISCFYPDICCLQWSKTSKSQTISTTLRNTSKILAKFSPPRPWSAGDDLWVKYSFHSVYSKPDPFFLLTMDI